MAQLVWVSADWIVVLPEVVLLVEVKSAIPTEPVRLGTPHAAAGGLALTAAAAACSGSDIVLQGGQLRRGGGGHVGIGTRAGLGKGL